MADRYKDLTHTAEEIDNTIDGFATHAADSVSHVTASEKASWNAKQDALTFDDVPTENSTNPVTSGGVYTPLAQDRAALVELVDGGAKNRIIFDGVGTSASNVGTSYTSNGITFEVQSDGTIRATGTISSGSSYCYLYAGTGRINIIDAFDGKHVLSGNPQGASTSTYRLWYKVGSQTAVSVGDSSVILPEVAGETNAVLGLQVDATQTNLDITFKPMICTLADWNVSQKFVPYRPSYDELIARIEALEGGAT